MKKSSSITLVFLGILVSVISGCGVENEIALTKEEQQEQDQQVYGHHSTIVPYYLMMNRSFTSGNVGSLNTSRGSSFVESIKSVSVKSHIARGGFGSIGRGLSAGA